MVNFSLTNVTSPLRSLDERYLFEVPIWLLTSAVNSTDRQRHRHSVLRRNINTHHCWVALKVKIRLLSSSFACAGAIFLVHRTVSIQERTHKCQTYTQHTTNHHLDTHHHALQASDRSTAFRSVRVLDRPLSYAMVLVLPTTTARYGHLITMWSLKLESLLGIPWRVTHDCLECQYDDLGSHW